MKVLDIFKATKLDINLDKENIVVMIDGSTKLIPFTEVSLVEAILLRVRFGDRTTVAGINQNGVISVGIIPGQSTKDMLESLEEVKKEETK